MTKQTELYKKILRTLFRIFLGLVLSILFLLLLISFILKVPFLQTKIVNEVADVLEKKLQTEISIGRIALDFPKSLVIEDFYLEDQQKDTLAYVGRLGITVDFLPIFNKKVSLKDVELDNTVVKLIEYQADSLYNYQFLLNAFPSDTTTTADTTKSELPLIFAQKVALTNVRFQMNSQLDASDMDFYVGNLTSGVEINLNTGVYNIEHSELKNAWGEIVLGNPTAKEEIQPTDTTNADITINVKSLTATEVNYKQSDVAMEMLLEAKLPHARIDHFSLTLLDQWIVSERFYVSGAEAHLKMLPIPPNTTTLSSSEKTSNATSELFNTGWNMKLKEGKLENMAFSLYDHNVVEQEKGMDYSHLSFEDIAVNLEQFQWVGDDLRGMIHEISLSEGSGFKLKDFESVFHLSSFQINLQALKVLTSASKISGAISLKMPKGITAMTDSKGSYFDIKLPQTTIGKADVFTFVPALAENVLLDSVLSEKIYVDLNALGGFDSLNIHTFKLKMLSNTTLDVKGYLNHLLTVDRLGGNVKTMSVVLPPADLRVLQNSLELTQIQLLQDSLFLKGNFIGDLGNWDGKLKLLYGKNKIVLKADHQEEYHANMAFKFVQLGQILKNPSIGKIKGNLLGTASDIFWSDSLRSNLTLQLEKLIYDSLAFDKSTINASLKDEIIQSDWTITAPFIASEGSTQLALKDSLIYLKPNFKINDLKPSFFSSLDSSITISCAVAGDFTFKDSLNFHSNVHISELDFSYGQKEIAEKEMSIHLTATDTLFATQIAGDLIQLDYAMKSELAELGADFQSYLHYYYPFFDRVPMTDFPELTLDFQVMDFGVLSVFDTHLKIEKMMPLHLNIASESKQSTADFALIGLEYNQFHIDSISFDLQGNKEDLGADLILHKFSPSDSIGFDSLEFYADFKDQKLDFKLYANDEFKEDFTWIDLGFTVGKSKNLNVLSLHEALTVNNTHWAVNPQNKIELSAFPFFDQFSLHGSDNTKLAIQSSVRNNVPFTDLSIEEFELDPLFDFIGFAQDSIHTIFSSQLMLVQKEGLLNAEGKINLDEITVRGQPIGKFQNDFKFYEKENITFDLSLIGAIGNINLAGNYPFDPTESLEAQLAIAPFNYAPLHVFTSPYIAHLDGELNGKINVKGSVEEPSVRGNIDFTSASFMITPLNVELKGNGGNINFDQTGVHINEVSFLDYTNHGLRLEGDIFTKHYKAFDMDIQLHVKEFTALDSKQSDDLPYYGKFIVSTLTNIQGSFENPKVDTKLEVLNGTNTTYIYSSESDNNRGEDVVIFIQKDQTVAVDKKLTGMDLDINIGIEDEVMLHILLDERTGDLLSIQGGGDLLFDLDSLENMSLNGKFEVNKGSYKLTLYKVIPKSFELDKGSYLYWSGDITSPLIDITATYRVKASPSLLVESYMQSIGSTSSESSSPYSKRRIFDVKMKMSGYLDNPELSFDILYPVSIETNDSDNTIEQALAYLRENPNVMNKEVFGLLALGAFVPTDEAVGSSSLNEATTGLLSNFLSDRLNEFSNDFLKGVDLNFNVEQYDQSTSSGETGSRTDVGVSLKKNLFNDRLTILIGGAVAVQDEVTDATNSFSTDVEVEYKIKKDGQLRIKAYSENADTNFGNEVYKNGLTLLFQRQYTKVRELFRKTPQQIETEEKDKKQAEASKETRKEQRRKRREKRAKKKR